MAGPVNRLVERGGIWVFVQMGLLLAVALSAVLLRGDWKSPLASQLGVCLLVAGGVCMLAGAVSLGRGLTPFPAPRRETRLVQHGIYRFVRHPLYTAVFCAAVGWGLWWQSWPSLMVSSVLAIFLDAKARREERWLREQFSDYADYERRVRRFIPWIY